LIYKLNDYEILIVKGGNWMPKNIRNATNGQKPPNTTKRQNVPTATKRKWLKLYDEGKSYSDISIKEDKDIKTVRAGIETARHEQWVNSAQAEMYKKALEKHQTLLVEAVSGLLAALVLPDPEIRENLRGAISGGKVSYTPEEGLVVTLDAESKPEWALLREHLKRHRLWKVLKAWKTELLTYLNSLDKLRKESIEEVDNFDQLPGYIMIEPGKDPSSGCFVYPGTLVDILYRIGINRALSPDKILELNKKITVLDENVLFESKKVVKTTGDPEECRRIILNFLTRFNLPRKNFSKFEGITSHGDLKTEQAKSEFQNRINNIRDSYESLKKSSEQLKSIAQDIVLLGIITGNCHLCSKLGV
jgi:hypothetical protein